MIAVDTNIVVRLLTGDDRQQSAKARALFEAHDIHLPDTVILESEWVLRYAYEYRPEAIGGAFTKLLGLPNVHVDDPTVIAQAIQWHEQGLDFADALHLAQCQKSDQFYSFDNAFIRKAKGLGSCTVLKP